MIELMIPGVFQKLTIIEQTETRLVLREQPLLDWLVVGILMLVMFVLLLVELWITALVALIVAVIFLIQAQSRVITFDAHDGMFTIQQFNLRGRCIVYHRPLREIRRANLYKADDGSTQIILVDVTGEDMGLSVYSRDIAPWKDDIVIAINAILHQIHMH